MQVFELLLHTVGNFSNSQKVILRERISFCYLTGTDISDVRIRRAFP